MTYKPLYLAYSLGLQSLEQYSFAVGPRTQFLRPIPSGHHAVWLYPLTTPNIKDRVCTPILKVKDRKDKGKGRGFVYPTGCKLESFLWKDVKRMLNFREDFKSN